MIVSWNLPGCVAALMFLSSPSVFACNGPAPRLPVATFAQALNPRAGEISFIGKIVDRHRSLRLRVLRRIQGYVPETTVVEMGCSYPWGFKEGDIVPVIAYYEADDLLLGVGSDFQRGADGKFYRGRDLALTFDERRSLRKYRTAH